MFTIKVMRKRGPDERVDIYRTPHPAVYTHDRADRPPVRVVTWRDPGTDEWPAVALDRDYEPTPEDDGWCAHTVVVENEHGHTTEVVRA